MYIFTLTKTCHSERLLFRISVWEVEDMLVSSAKGTRRIFFCLSKSFSSTDLVVQVPCLSSLLPIDLTCSVG